MYKKLRKMPGWDYTSSYKCCIILCSYKWVHLCALGDSTDWCSCEFASQHKGMFSKLQVYIVTVFVQQVE